MKGVGQWCNVFPILFNIHVKKSQNALDANEGHMKITPINNLKYADDTAIITDNIQFYKF